MVVRGFAVLTAVMLMISINTAYAQTVPEQGSLSGDLENNPIAQDILKKIEKSKRWIEKIQKRDFETAEKQKN